MDSTPEDSSSCHSNLAQDISLALQDILCLQQSHIPSPFELCIKFTLPRYAYQRKGDIIDSFMCSLFAYFKYFPSLVKK